MAANRSSMQARSIAWRTECDDIPGKTVWNGSVTEVDGVDEQARQSRPSLHGGSFGSWWKPLAPSPTMQALISPTSILMRQPSELCRYPPVRCALTHVQADTHVVNEPHARSAIKRSNVPKGWEVLNLSEPMSRPALRSGGEVRANVCRPASPYGARKSAGSRLR